MITKNRLKFLRGPVHKIPCHEFNCKTMLHTRAYNKKYCHIHCHMAKMGKMRRKNVKKRQTDIQSPYGRFGETTQKLCLKCGDSFGSISRFNKLCEPCNQDNEIIKQHIGNISNSSLNMKNYNHSNLDYGGLFMGDL